MKTKQVTTGAALVGVLAGAAGLVAVTVPAGAESAPELPKTSPEALVGSVLTAKPTAFGGTVEAKSDLGIPLPGLAQGKDGNYNAEVYYDGDQRFRASMQQQGGSRHTVIEDGKSLWNYDSSERTAAKAELPQQAKQHERARQGDPSELAKRLVGKLRESSTLNVDGTAEVAGRDAYELVLTPKPSEKTLVREARVAVDSQTRMPLRIELFGNGSTTPALEAGFTKLDVGKQDPGLFSFTPPPGAKVTTVDPKQHMDKAKQQRPEQLRRIGSGWDTVLSGKLAGGQAAQLTQKPGDAKQSGAQQRNFIDQFAKPVEGKFGKGRVVNTSVGTALITEDGRFAAGLVPREVLEQALETK